METLTDEALDQAILMCQSEIVHFTTRLNTLIAERIRRALKQTATVSYPPAA